MFRSSTPYLVNYGKGYANLQSKIFFIWFGCCFLCIAFVYFFIYETKGLTLEQVDQLYEEVSVARKSTAWQPKETWEHRRSLAHQGGLGADGDDSSDRKGNSQTEQINATHYEKHSTDV